LRVENFGQVAYRPMLQLQRARHAEVIHGADDSLFLLEHSPVVTLGKNSGAKNVLLSPAALGRRGIELVETDRGGDVTYHGPGQLVGYPILHLEEHERDVKAYVARLEEILIRTVRDYGISAARVEGLRGIWVGNEKIAAIGVRIAQWATLHGFALNANTDLTAFSCIVPCGIHDRGVTSMQKLLGARIDLLALAARVAFHAGVVLEREVVVTPASDLAALVAPDRTATTTTTMGLAPAAAMAAIATVAEA
jgi:lipoyl(octanoyl) transferase